MAAPDVVYICRPGDDNEELRYSLRSLINLPHGRVFIVGDAPSWVRNVEIRRSALMRDKQLTAARNLWVACSDPEISDPFYVFNDDFFIMQPMEFLPVLDMGPMPAVIDQHRAGSAYRNAMEKTYARLLELGIGAPKSFELHIPMLIEKVGMLLALSLGEGIHGLHNRTMYGNLMELESTEAEDVKVYPGSSSLGYEYRALLSTTDRSFQFHPVGRYIKRTFEEPSPYEVRERARSAIRHSTTVVHPWAR